MGIDFLDFTFRLQKKFHLRFVQDEKTWESYRHAQTAYPARNCVGMRTEWWDIRLDRFFAFVQERLRPCCTQCAKSSKKLDPCSECHLSRQGSLTWDEFREALGEVVAVSPAEMREETWLIRDLGFS